MRKHKSLALERLSGRKESFIVCPFRSGENPMVTMFGTFRTTCRIFQEMEEKRRATHNPPVYGCFDCPLGGKVESEMKVEDVPPWVIIADDTPEKREVFYQLKKNSVVQTKYACMLIAFARESHDCSELKELVKERERELMEKPAPHALDGERNLTDEERAEKKEERKRKEKRKRREKDEETILSYSPLKVPPSEELEIWKEHRKDGLTKAAIGMRRGISPHVVAKVVEKQDLIRKRKEKEGK